MSILKHMVLASLVSILMVSTPANAAPATDVICTGCVGTTDIAANAVISSNIKDGEVKTADIANNAVTTTKIKDGEVKTADIANQAVTEQKLAQALLDRITQLEATVRSLNTTVASLRTTVNNQNTVLRYFSVVRIADPNNASISYPTVRITSANLQIVNGPEAVLGSGLNGLGNLIVGYNPLSAITSQSTYRCSNLYYTNEGACTGAGFTWAINHRGGSHNLIVGGGNNYPETGGFVAGWGNTVGHYASVSGGVSNIASGDYASVSGGLGNKASGTYTSVSGGNSNTASGSYASVSGGWNNKASGNYASVSGGQSNTVSGHSSSVSGGNSNTASGYSSSVSGGDYNTALGHYSSVSGGRSNRAYDSYSSVSGGMSNTAFGSYSSVSGGNSRSTLNAHDWQGGSFYQDN